MYRPRSLLLFSVLIFYSAFGDSKNVEKSEITEDFKKGDSRMDAEQDPYTSVTYVAQAGDAQSTLFSTCIAASRTFQAKFASIEVVNGSEYLRYVPDSVQLSSPMPWKITNGTCANILDCAQAAHDGGWPMFKYNGAKCEVVNTTFSLCVVPACEENASDAVFIISTSRIGCEIPRFVVGFDTYLNADVMGLISTDLMTFDEAKIYCDGVGPNNELTLYLNGYSLDAQDVRTKLIALGYTTKDLWVNMEEFPGQWVGGFYGLDFWDGQLPANAGPYTPQRVAYMDKDAGFLLRVSDRNIKRAAFCATPPPPPPP